MLGLQPFDILGQGRPHHAGNAPAIARHYPALGISRKRYELDQRTLEPVIESHATDEAYQIDITAPEGQELFEARASVNGRELTLHGVLERQDVYFKYSTAGRTGVYAAPGRDLIGIFPARTLLRGTAPTRGGWIELDEEEGWVAAEDLNLIARPPPPERFEKSLMLPADALLQQATRYPLKKSGLRISVPRGSRNSQLFPKFARTAPHKQKVPVTTSGSARQASTMPQMQAATAVTSHTENRAPLPAVSTEKSSCSTTSQRTCRTWPELTLAGGRPPPSNAGPVLMEVDEDTSNVQCPEESTHDWLASPDGGFEILVRT